MDGTKAAWFAGDGILLWEADGVSYEIAGRMLTLDEALRIWKGM